MRHDLYLANDLIIRSLEAKLAKMEARVSRLEALKGRHASRKTCATRPATPEESRKTAPILDSAARMYGCTVAEICGSRGSKRTILARADAAYECQRLGMSSVAIGRVLGGRDHSTVLHMIGRHKERLGL